MSKGLLLVISAPSGAGKSTLCRALAEKHPDLRLSVSCTTRRPRPGETPGRDYFFLTEEEFQKRIGEGAFIEWARVHDHLYGTPKGPVQEQLDGGRDVLLNIDPQGALSVKALFPDSVRVYLFPPSWEVLESRLRGRGQDDEGTIAKRMSNARREMSFLPQYDYAVANVRLEDAVSDVLAILRAERRRADRVSSEWRPLLAAR